MAARTCGEQARLIPGFGGEVEAGGLVFRSYILNSFMNGCFRNPMPFQTLNQFIHRSMVKPFHIFAKSLPDIMAD